jgi:hypothetical protein
MYIFCFEVSGLFDSPFYAYSVMYRVEWLVNFERPACGVLQMLNRNCNRSSVHRRYTVNSL